MKTLLSFLISSAIVSLSAWRIVISSELKFLSSSILGDGVSIISAFLFSIFVSIFFSIFFSSITFSTGASFFTSTFSFGSPIIAIALFTGILASPSLNKRSRTTPSSTASTSIVALSVSISAIKSPALTVSPFLINHLDRFPSVIVGDNAGIKISVLIIYK